MSNSRVYAKLLGLARFKGTYETKNFTDHDPEKLLHGTTFKPKINCFSVIYRKIHWETPA